MTRNQYKNKVYKDRITLESRAISDARPHLRRLSVALLQTARTRRAETLTDALKTAQDALGRVLLSAAVIGHVQGRDAIQELRRGPLTLARSNPPSLYEKTLQLDRSERGRLVDLYKPRINTSIKNANKRAEAALQKALQQIIEKNLHLQDGILLLQKSMQKAGVSFDRPFLYETLVRSEVNLAVSGGQLEFMKVASDEIWGYEFSAIVDDRTTDDICRPLNGIRRKKDDPFWESGHIPLTYEAETGMYSLPQAAKGWGNPFDLIGKGNDSE
jgi:hypothetical protein